MAGAPVDVQSKAELDRLIKARKAAAVHLWASWCEPCKHMDTVFAQLASDHPAAAFIRVEAEEVADISEEYDISAVPFFLFFKDGSLVDKLEGANPPELTRKVTAHLRGASSAVEGPVRAVAAPAPTPSGAPTATPTTQGDLQSRLKALMNAKPVMLFMKGDAQQPRCGFSRKVVDALQEEKVDFGTFDILSDEQVRQGLKELSNWPTYPQLYCNGELVGGCDIIMEMHQSGELREHFEEKGVVQQLGNLQERLKALVNQRPVMLFMKGTPEEPRCGFSRKVVDALRETGVEFGSFDILSDEGIRQGLKEFSNWPTFPQLYAKGDLVGGCDIVLEMHKEGELKEALAVQ